MSRFPKVSETFIVNEIVSLQREGWSISLYPLGKSAEKVVHPVAVELVASARYLSVLSLGCVIDHLRWISERPGPYFRAFLLTFSLPGMHIRFYPRTVWTFLWAVRVALDIKNSGVRHVHAHWATYPAQAAMVVARLTGCTFSFTAHAHDIYANAYGLKSKIEQASFVVTISDYNRQRLLQETGGVGDIEVIRCGVDTAIYAPPESGRSGIRELKILAVGTLEEKKGHRYLIEACSLLRRRGYSPKCRIIGEGSERSVLEKLINELDLQGSVILVGSLTSDGVAAELNSADVFVMPSIVAGNGMMEGIPVALMEAMSVGLPVIATSTSGIPELVTDGMSGMLIPPRDARAIADKIEILYHDEDLCLQLGLAAREVVESRYNLMENCRQLGRRFEEQLHLNA